MEDVFGALVFLSSDFLRKNSSNYALSMSYTVSGKE
jgi:hypothetical protein